MVAAGCFDGLLVLRRKAVGVRRKPGTLSFVRAAEVICRHAQTLR